MRQDQDAEVVVGRDDLAGAVAVVLPAKNEAATLPSVLAGLPASVVGLPVRAIVVDDASSDRTVRVAMDGGAHVLHLPVAAGQGRALRAGYRHAVAGHAAVVVSMDADGQHRAEDLATLVEPVVHGEADIVTGSRVLGSADRGPRVRQLGIPVLARVMSLLTSRRVTDPACGYRAMSASVLARMDLRQDQFHTAEYLVHAARLGLTVREVPVTIRLRQAGESRKPPTTRYAVGFVTTMVVTWGRGRGRGRGRLRVGGRGRLGDGGRRW